jgi:hypothetical protein
MVFVVRPSPPTNLKGRTASESDLGVLRKIGINWSKDTL